MMPVSQAIKLARENSPYLRDSLTLYPEIGDGLLSQPAREIWSNLSGELPEEVDDLNSEMTRLRILKRRCHLLLAIADVAGDWEWPDVTARLTEFADLCMQRLLIASARDVGIEGAPDNPAPGVFVMAMGKYGAGELNYSSDIDFNVFYDPSRVELPNVERAERTLIRLVQNLVKGFERVTADGYIFRTDLRLRPDPRSTSVAVSTSSAERYYETLGQNWERAAMIKARICAGDQHAGAEFVENVIHPFVWRRNLDYATIDDILAMKRQIDIRHGANGITPAGHNVKLGPGGIREIEFFAQIQQLILGGRHSDLRVPRTVDALDALAARGFVSEAECEELKSAYADLRSLEHRVQMIIDEQSHTLPETAEERLCIARLSGEASLEAFDARVERTLGCVRKIYADLFPEIEPLTSREGTLSFTGVEPNPETLATLERLGFVDAERVWSNMAEWLGGRIRATRSERAREYLTRLAPYIVDFCADTGRPDTAFSAFAGFITRLAGGVAQLSMFSQEPARLKDLIFLMSHSDLIAQRLADQPTTLDVMADPDFLSPRIETIGENYFAACGQIDDFEHILNAIRRCVREDHFRVVASCLRQHISIDAMPGLFSRIAECAIAAVLPAAQSEAERSTGPISGDYAVIGMGKLGGRELRLTSDLDVMMVYEAAVGEDDVQRKYSRLTQRFISALSSVTEEGGLFEVDMALRPSGRSGPVAVSVEAFARYYREKAWTWEFMALTRAQVIAASSDAFQERMTHILSEAFAADRPDLHMSSDIAEMLKRVRSEKPARTAFDIKNLNGGLRDIEFCAQKLLLLGRENETMPGNPSTSNMLQAIKNRDHIKGETESVLAEALEFYNRASQLFSISNGNAVPSTLEELPTTLNLMGCETSNAFQDALNGHQAGVSAITDKLIFESNSG